MVGSPFNSLLGSFRQHSHDFSLQGVQHKNFLKNLNGWSVPESIFFSFRLKYLLAVISLQRHISKFDQEIFFSSSSIIRTGNNLLRKMKVDEGTRLTNVNSEENESFHFFHFASNRSSYQINSSYHFLITCWWSDETM